MMIKLALLQSNKQLHILTVDPTENSHCKTLDYEDILDERPQLLIYDDTQEENSYDFTEIEKWIQKFPIYPLSHFNFTTEEFQNFSYSDGFKVYSLLIESWILSNNISLIEEHYQLQNHLKPLWEKERVTFFEEFWNILKKNLGTKNLRIIFNDIEISKKEHEKNRLIQSVIKGVNTPNPVKGGDVEEQLMDHYKKNFETPLEVLEFDKEKGQLVLCCQISQSPVLVMAETHSFNQLQKAIISTFIEGLSK